MEIEMKIPINQKTDNLSKIIDKMYDICYEDGDNPGLFKRRDVLYGIDGNLNKNLSVRIRTEKWDATGNTKDKEFVLNTLLLQQDLKYNYTRVWFTTKKKTVENCVEMNEEHETSVDNISQLEKSLNDMGYISIFEKEKLAFGMYTHDIHDPYSPYHIELVRVTNPKNRKTYLYCEIENTFPGNEKSKDFVIDSIKNLFKELGLDPDFADDRPWMEILK